MQQASRWWSSCPPSTGVVTVDGRVIQRNFHGAFAGDVPDFAIVVADLASISERRTTGSSTRPKTAV
jgi:hypothetical protein